ncbi:MAG: lasso peptide biosynthesis B2 protein [Alphaproteobacteria bacterium]|nr:lasso peptide biosynthesis B2 protein [Alphaproteobacteria bacterium]
MSTAPPSRLTRWLRVLEALVALSIASVVVRALPARHWLDARTATQLPAAGEEALPPPATTGAAAAVAHALARARRRLPWRPTCLMEGLAARAMLRRRGVPTRLVFGVRRTAEGMEAHAWVIAAQADPSGPTEGTVCGGPAAVGFSPLAAFQTRGQLGG